MREPACREDEHRPLPGGRVRDAPAVELAEANVLLHGPVNAMARSGHVKKMARRGEARAMRDVHHPHMHARFVNGLTIRPLRDGDTSTVAAVFARLGSAHASPLLRREATPVRGGARESRSRGRESPRPRRLRRPRSRAGRYRAPRPRGATAEIAFAVADAHQGKRVGTILAGALAADARAAGIVELVATVCGDNPRVARADQAARFSTDDVARRRARARRRPRALAPRQARTWLAR